MGHNNINPNLDYEQSFLFQSFDIMQEEIKQSGETSRGVNPPSQSLLIFTLDLHYYY